MTKTRSHAKEFEGLQEMDGNDYAACTFVHAVLKYSGGPPPNFKGYIFNGVKFEFAGAAANTVAFLQALYASRSGFSSIVRQAFPHISGSGLVGPSWLQEEKSFVLLSFCQ